MELEEQPTKRPAYFLPFVLLAVVIGVYWPTFRELFSVWAEWDHSLSHGYPLAFIFLFLIYRSLPWPIGTASRERILGLVGLLVSSVVWFLLYSIKIKVLEQFSLMFIIIFLMISVFGFRKIWDNRLVFLLPIYIIPFWDYINDSLVNLSSYMVGLMVTMTKMPALIDGNSIHIPAGQIIIADGCSGLRYLIISLALAHIISALNGYREKGLLIALCVAGVLGLVTNWLRIFILICVGYATDMQSSLMTDHEMFGWILFGCICLPVIYFSPVVKSKTPAIDPASLAMPKAKWLLASLLILVSGPLLSLVFTMKPTAMQKHYQVDSKAFVSSLQEMPHSLKLGGTNVQTNYVSADNGISLQINIFTPKGDSHQLVPYIGRQFDIESWKNTATAQVVVAGRKINLQIFQSKVSGRKIVQAQWFDVGGFPAATMLGAKLNQIPALFGGKQYFAIITLQSVCHTDDCEDVKAAVAKATTSVH